MNLFDNHLAIQQRLFELLTTFQKVGYVLAMTSALYVLIYQPLGYYVSCVPADEECVVNAGKYESWETDVELNLAIGLGILLTVGFGAVYVVNANQRRAARLPREGGENDEGATMAG